MDPDEFFYPNNPSFSLIAEFKTQPSYVSSLRFMNFEGQPEIGDVKNRYEQVTLFRQGNKFQLNPSVFSQQSLTCTVVQDLLSIFSADFLLYSSLECIHAWKSSR